MLIAPFICSLSKLSRYIWVTRSELCPMISRIKAVDTPVRFITVAWLYRATYVVNVWGRPKSSPISLSRFFTLAMTLWIRLDFCISVSWKSERIGNRYGLSLRWYFFISSIAWGCRGFWLACLSCVAYRLLTIYDVCWGEVGYIYEIDTATIISKSENIKQESHIAISGLVGNNSLLNAIRVL